MSKPIWPKSSARVVTRSVAAHSVIGLALSALLYIVCLSGTVAVFEDEIEWWENPASAPVENVSPQAMQRTAEAALAADPETTHLHLFVPREGWPRYVVSTDNETIGALPSGELGGAHTGPWAEFMIDLHYYLHLPHSFGMIVVAILGVAMLALSISGFLAHPRIFRDAFTFRNQAKPRVAQLDLHNRFSVWTAPFNIAVSLTGAMIGLFSVVGVAIAMVGFDGDIMALYASIFGAEPAPDPTAAPMADIATAMSTMTSRFPDAVPFWIMVHDPGTLGQHVQIMGEHTDRLIYAEYYNFNAAGEFTGRTGFSDGPVGQQVASSVYRLHFGAFGGMGMKLAYGLLGLALCAVVATGLNIYFLKRAEKGRPAPRLESAWSAVIWGTPAMLALTLFGSIIGLLPQGALTPVFWLGLFACIGAGLYLARNIRIGRILRLVTAGLMALAAIAHTALFASDVSSAYVAGTSIALVLLVAALTGPEWRRRLPALGAGKDTGTKPGREQPAE